MSNDSDNNEISPAFTSVIFGFMLLPVFAVVAIVMREPLDEQQISFTNDCSEYNGVVVRLDDEESSLACIDTQAVIFPQEINDTTGVHQ